MVDASVVGCWFLPEPDGAEARRLLDAPGNLVSPDVIFPEIIRVVQQKVRRGWLRPAQGRRLLADLTTIAVHTVDCRGLVPEAWALSAPWRPVLDSVYLALAVRLQTYLVTADRQVQEHVATTPRLAAHVLHVRDWTGPGHPAPAAGRGP